MRVAWHDAADAALAAEGLALAEEQRGRARLWWLEPLGSTADKKGESPPAPPGVVPAILAEADHLAGLGEALGRTLPDGLRTVARFEGTRRSATIAAAPGEIASEIAGETAGEVVGEIAEEAAEGTAGQIALDLLEGTLHTARADRRLARLRLSGPPVAVFALADQLLADLPCTVPATSLAAEALSFGAEDVSPPSGLPVLPSAIAVSGALAWMVASLARTLVALAPSAASGEGSEPVHQMRVALRRLRTAMTLLKPLVPGPAALTEATAGLGTLARALGPAREWDVFLEGTGPAVAAAFPKDAPLARLLKAARRRRDTAYAALRAELDQADFRRLILRLAALAVLRPWETPSLPARDMPDEAHGHAVPEAEAETALAEAAPALMQRRYRKLLSAASDIETADAVHLHAIRLRAKRLRYAGELLSPFFPRRDVQRFIRRLARLQDRLGTVNDAVAVERLLAELGPAGSGEAGGVVRGFVAANALRERARVEAVWRKFRKQTPFWT
ncbi:MAG TPA: CHAD domain-containing protein [Acetobacteraceae bacterium]|nr:CHAD domain-containing protein [Acetobacteraceae bacterium]